MALTACAKYTNTALSMPTLKTKGLCQDARAK